METVGEAVETPALMLDPTRAVAAYEALAARAAPLRVRYAVKANAHPALLDALAAAGADFAISSLPDLEALAALGIDGRRASSVSPGPPASLLRRCRVLGVAHLTVDNPWELRKAAVLVPGAALSVALRLPAAGRLRYPAAPVGCPLDDLDALLAAARGLPVEIAGLAVHVGSQCERLASWRAAVALAGAAWRRLLAAGLRPRALSLGGGLPVEYRQRVPGPAAILRTIRAALAAELPSPPAEVWLEPGRYLAAGAGILAATVLAVERRPRRRPRLRLDVGRYHGLPEAALGIRYRFQVPGAPAAERYVVSGPLGARADLLDPDALLPVVAPGDRLYVLQAGAYTACQTAYPIAGAPPTVVLADAGRERACAALAGECTPSAGHATRARAAASRTPAGSSTRGGSAAGPRS